MGCNVFLWLNPKMDLALRVFGLAVFKETPNPEKDLYCHNNTKSHAITPVNGPKIQNWELLLIVFFVLDRNFVHSTRLMLTGQSGPSL